MANERPEHTDREYTLSPGSYVYVQDGTNGRIKTHTGPTTVTLTKGDSPIVYDGKGRFIKKSSLEEAVMKSVVAPEGFYVEMTNPAVDDKHPIESDGKLSPDLKIGHKIIVPGPAMFALWPGQSADVVRGHNLRSNQYVLVRVYNADEARKNWKSAVLVKATELKTPDGGAEAASGGAATTTAATAVQLQKTAEAPADLAVGKLLVLKGTDVSFYIPPTGVTVVQDENGAYVREAVTLEQLEYCILVDENGKKRIPRGPAVVFPAPTENFVRDAKKNIKFRAMELNPIQGIHVKVTQAYRDPVLGEKKEGEEIFITGKDYPIYFPIEQHALIRYDGKPINYAVAVPEGDGRYVLDRMAGKIRVERGAQMLLPNPIHEVIVRRPLSAKECGLWYPDNPEAAEYNRLLREAVKTVPTTRAGSPSDGDVMRSKKLASRGEGMTTQAYMSANAMLEASAAPVGVAAAVSAVGIDTGAVAGDEMSRSSSYTQPRTLTLGSKFEGVPKISVWTGYAVEVVNSKGGRRVVEGPQQVLLEYDEVLETLALSTGKPKNTDKLLETPYLLVKNNKVADIIKVETSDFVELEIKVSYKVDFEGDPEKWFAVSNYIKFLCDHGRSALKAAARKMTVEDLYANYLEFVHKNVLGPTGSHTFTENGMVVRDVEVLAVSIPDTSIAALLRNVQKEVVASNLQVSSARKKLSVAQDLEALKLQEIQTKTETSKAVADLEIEQVQAALKKALAAYKSELDQQDARGALAKAQVEVNNVDFDAQLANREKAAEIDLEIAQGTQAQRLAEARAEAENLALKLASLKDGFGEALMALSNNETMAKVAGALSVQYQLGGRDVVDVLGKIFQGTGLQTKMDKVLAPANGAVALQAPKQ